MLAILHTRPYLISRVFLMARWFKEIEVQHCKQKSTTSTLVKTSVCFITEAFSKQAAIRG